MATVDTLTKNQINALTQTTTASGTVYNISGVLEDENFGLMVKPVDGGAGGNLVIYSGDYQNAGLGNYTGAVAASGIYVTGELDGARFRKEDGTIDVAFTAPTGIIAAWTY